MTDFFASYPPTVASAGVPTYANLAAFPAASIAGNGALAIALDTDILYISNGTIWEPIASPGSVLSVGTFDSGSPSANGAHIDSNALIMQSASATNPGLINVSTQTLAGVKTFNSNPIMSGLTASQVVVTDGSKALASLAYATASTATTLAERDSSGNLTAKQLISDIATGTAPLVVTSTTQVANLNAATAGSFSGSLLGDVTGTQSATVLSATTNGTLTTLSGLTTASNLVTVGTITSGTWSATTIAVNKGGTGQVTAAAAFNALSPITTTGDMIYSPSGATSQRLAIGSTGNVLTVTGGVPTWAPPATSGTVTSVAMTVPTFLSIAGSPITSSGTLAVTLSGTALPVANGGTGLTSGTSGGILGYTASGTLASSAALTANQLIIGGGAGVTPSTLAAGSQFQVLVMGATTPGYGQVNLAQSAAITGTLPIGNGGTGVTSVTSTPTASAWSGWDASSNAYAANNIVGLGDATGTTTAGTLRGPARTGSNAAGVDLTFDAGNGTGTGGSGHLILRTAPVAGSSSTANTFANRFDVSPAGLITIGTAAGTQAHATNGSMSFSTGIVGRTSGTSYAAGTVGEIIQQTRVSSNLNLTTGQFADGTTSPIALTAGTWLITVGARFNRDAGIVQTDAFLFVGTATGNVTTGLIASQNSVEWDGSLTGANLVISLMTGSYYVNISGTTNYYCKVFATFTGSGNCFVTDASITGVRIGS